MNIKTIIVFINFLIFGFSLIINNLMKVEPSTIFIFCGGLVNLVAVIDISKVVFVSNYNVDRRVLLTSFTQLLLLAIIIGIDTWLFLAEFYHLRIILTLLLFVFLWYLLAFIRIDDGIKRAIFLFGLFIIFCIFLVPAFIDIFKQPLISLIESYSLFFKNNKLFILERIYSWLHLTFLPLLIYVIPDIIIRDKIIQSMNSLPLDWGIFFAGVACSGAGLVIKDPKFESGACAAILILGNYIYSIYINNDKLIKYHILI